MSNNDYNSGKASAVKFFMPLACISSVVVGIADIAAGSLIVGVILLVSLTWGIPMTVYVYRQLNRHKPIGTGFKICVLIFHHIIAGIILLCMKTDGEDEEEEQAADTPSTATDVRPQKQADSSPANDSSDDAALRGTEPLKQLSDNGTITKEAPLAHARMTAAEQDRDD